MRRIGMLTTAAVCCTVLMGCGASPGSPAIKASADPSPTRADATVAAQTDAPQRSRLPKAPDFTLRTLDGDTFTLSDHIGELPVVLNFWAPW